MAWLVDKVAVASGVMQAGHQVARRQARESGAAVVVIEQWLLYPRMGVWG